MLIVMNKNMRRRKIHVMSYNFNNGAKINDFFYGALANCSYTVCIGNL